MLRILFFISVWGLVGFAAAHGKSSNASELLNLLLAIVGAFVMAPFEALGMRARAAVQAWLVVAGLLILLALWRAALDRSREAIGWASLAVNLAGFVIAYRTGMTAEEWMGFR